MKSNSLFIKGVKDGIPIFLGYLAVSFTFGISAVANGISTQSAVFMSALNFTSAGQFAAISVITKSLSYFELAITQFIINLRYCLMSSALSQKFESKMPKIHRFLISFGNTDEVFGVLSSFDGKLPPVYCYGVLLGGLPGWVIGTLLGAVLGNVLPHRLLSALGVALYGMFIAIIVPPARKNKFIAVIILIAMICSAVFSYMPILKSISSGFRIIILTVIISAFAAVIRPIEDKKEENGNER